MIAIINTYNRKIQNLTIGSRDQILEIINSLRENTIIAQALETPEGRVALTQARVELTRRALEYQDTRLMNEIREILNNDSNN